LTLLTVFPEDMIGYLKKKIFVNKLEFNAKVLKLVTLTSRSLFASGYLREIGHKRSSPHESQHHFRPESSQFELSDSNLGDLKPIGQKCIAAYNYRNYNGLTILHGFPGPHDANPTVALLKFDTIIRGSRGRGYFARPKW